MPNYQFDLYSTTLLVAAVLSAGVALYAWSQRRAHSAIALCLMSLSIMIWSFGHAFEMAGTTYTIKIFWAKINNIGIVLAPIAWLIFAVRHTLRGMKPPRWVMGALLIIPAISLILVFTNEMHHLFWSDVKLVETEQFIALDYTFGPWFWVHAAYSYVLLLVGAGLIFRSLARREGIYRGQAVALLTAVFAPWVSNVIFLANLSPIPYLDLTPFAFTISILCLAWAIFGYQLVNISPLARDRLVDSMPDGMIVLDGRGHIADMNPAAGRMIGIPGAQAIGKAVGDIFSPWPHVAELLRQMTTGDSIPNEEISDAIVVGEGEARRQYALRITSLQDQQGHSLGRVITLRDANQGAVPQPRFAPRQELTASPDKVESPGGEAPSSRIVHLRWLTNFLRTPIQTNLQAPPDVNPKWFQARERSFTLILRVAAIIGTAAWFIAPSFSEFKVSLPFGIILILLWFLGLARKINFNLRTAIFLVLVYLLAFTETFNFGYSVESFTFFMTLIVTAVLLLGRNGGLIAFGVSVVTLGIFGAQIGRGVFIPASAIADAFIMPDSVQRAATALIVFSASAAALIVSVTILMESLNKAWQLETQALNLLQQERDLLDFRIQERTQALAEARDEAIHSSNELHKYFQAIEQSGNTITITDTTGKIEYANPKFTELTGYKPDEVLGQNASILQSGEHDREFYKNLWDTISSGQVWQGEFHNRRKDSSLFWESATIAPVIDHTGAITNYVAIKEDVTAQKELQEQLRIQNQQMAREITERIRAETALEESEARFRQIVENASDILCRVDPEGHFTYLNPTGLRILGYQESDLMGCHFADLIAPRARQRISRLYLQQVLKKIPNTYQEFPVITGDGREIWLGQNVQIILEGDKVVGLQALARDITERKLFEDALSLARDQALEASQLKSQLLSKVNHELRTPLGAILGFGELLRSGTFGELTEQQLGAATQIVDSVNYLTSIVNELLDIAQIEARKVMLRMDECNPRQLLKDVEASMAILAHNKGLTFSTSATPDLPQTILGDERRLKQILINLAGNAIKYTQKGEVNVKVYRADSSHWAMEVHDTGIGIPAEAQAYIFEPFRQVQSTSTSENRGTGLGLSITRQLVELMGGEINLKSDPGRGSVFTVKLPIRGLSELGTRPLRPFEELSS